MKCSEITSIQKKKNTLSADLVMKVASLSRGGAALTPPGAVMSSTSLLSCSVWVCSSCSVSLGKENVEIHSFVSLSVKCIHYVALTSQLAPGLWTVMEGLGWNC